MKTIEERVADLEKVAHAPIDLTAIVSERAEVVARLFESDPHQFSSRPCETCRTITGVLGRAFGCSKREKSR